MSESVNPIDPQIIAARLFVNTLTEAAVDLTRLMRAAGELSGTTFTPPTPQPPPQAEIEARKPRKPKGKRGTGLQAHVAQWVTAQDRICSLEEIIAAMELVHHEARGANGRKNVIRALQQMGSRLQKCGDEGWRPWPKTK